MRRGLRVLLCTAAWALLIVSGLFLWAAVDYCRSIPTLYSFFGTEALEEKLARGIIWVGIQGLGALFSAALCLIVTRAALKRRKNTREKRKNHENTAFDTERY